MQKRQPPEVPLIPRLDEALSRGDAEAWKAAVKACHEAGQPDLPESRREKFRPLAEELDKRL